MSCLKAIFPCCFPPAEENEIIVLQELEIIETTRDEPVAFKSILTGQDATPMHEPGKVGFIHSVLGESQFSPLLCSTKLVDEEKTKSKSAVDVGHSFHTGGTLSESFWKDIKRWDEQPTVAGNNESLLRRHTLGSLDAKHISADTDEFSKTNEIPAYPFPQDLTQSSSSLSLDSTVPSSIDEQEMQSGVPEIVTESMIEGRTPELSDDEDGAYDIASHEAKSPKFFVGSLPNVHEESVVTITRNRSVDWFLSTNGTQYTSMVSSPGRFTVAPVEEQLQSLKFKADGSVQFKSL